MFRSTSSLILILGLGCLAQAKPGLFDAFKSNKCTDTPTQFCAMVFDDEGCNEGDWTPLGIRDGESRSFSILQANPLTGLDNLFNYKNDIESLTVKKGCTLTVYKDSDYSGGEYAFTAPNDKDLIVKELDEGPYKEFDEDIESVKCICQVSATPTPQPGAAGKLNSAPGAPSAVQKNNGPPRPDTCYDVPVQFGAMAWDDADCKLEDWNEPVGLQNGQDKAWNLLSDPSDYAKYANTIESIYVRRGCNLTVYDDGDFSDDPFSFVAKEYDIYVTLDSPPSSYSTVERAQIKGLDDSIRSMKLVCA